MAIQLSGVMLRVRIQGTKRLLDLAKDRLSELEDSFEEKEQNQSFVGSQIELLHDEFIELSDKLSDLQDKQTRYNNDVRVEGKTITQLLRERKKWEFLKNFFYARCAPKGTRNKRRSYLMDSGTTRKVDDIVAKPMLKTEDAIHLYKEYQSKIDHIQELLAQANTTMINFES